MSFVGEIDVPPRGWIYTVRTAINMSLSQFAKRLNKTVPSVREIEEREQNRTITLKKLIEVADALDLRFFYFLVPKDVTLEKLIKKRALQLAQEIVLRTSHSMSLEEQKPSDERLQKAIRERAENIKLEMPKYLWD